MINIGEAGKGTCKLRDGTLLDKNIFDYIYLFVQDTESDTDTVILELPSFSVSQRACDIPELKRTDTVFVSFSHLCVLIILS